MCMTGCQKHIVEANVREAYIEKLETNQIYKITCKEEINKIIYNVNSSKREFCIFIPDVKVVLIYRDNKKRIILINGNKPQFRSIIPCEVLLYIEVTFLGFIH